MIITEFITFLLSSLAVFSLVLFKVNNVFLQQITALFLIVLIILSGRVIFVRSILSKNKYMSPALLFLGTLVVQLLIISTGGFFSPFLILFHLFTVGASFLLSTFLAISFLIFSVSLLILSALVDSQMFALILGDPGIVILYLISLIVVFPLVQLLVYRYHLKDTLSKVLIEYIQIGEKREESILKGLSELIIVTDRNLNIISSNETTKDVLQVSEAAIVGKPLLAVISLKNSQGSPVTSQELYVENVLLDKATRIVNKLFLSLPKELKDHEMIVQVRPVTNFEGEVSQIVFIISEASLINDLLKHANLEQAQTKFKELTEQLEGALLKTNQINLAAYVELLRKIERDIPIASELEDHHFNNEKNMYDIAQLGKQAVLNEENFARFFGVHLEFFLPKEEVTEHAHLDLLETDISPTIISAASVFTIVTDGKLVKTVFEKLIDMAILLGSDKRGTTVRLSAYNSEDALKIVVTVPNCPLNDQQRQELFLAYYGELGKISNLRLGSGLEGFITRTILSMLNIPFEVDIVESKHLTFTLTFLKKLT